MGDWGGGGDGPSWFSDEEEDDFAGGGGGGGASASAAGAAAAASSSGAAAATATDGDAAAPPVPDKEAIVFLIDVSQPMFEPNAEGAVPFRNAVSVCREVLMTRVISRQSDLLGAVFYNSERRKNATDFNHIYVLHDLDVPDAGRIQDFMTLADAKRAADTVMGGTAAPTAAAFHEVLWACSYLFDNSGARARVGSRRIFLFTANDRPVAGDAAAVANVSRQRVDDLREGGVEIELFALIPSSGAFERAAFFGPLLDRRGAGGNGAGDDDDDDDEATAAARDAAAKDRTFALLEELEASVRARQFRKRVLARLPLVIGDGTSEVALKLFNLLHPASRGSFVWLTADSLAPVQTHTTYVAAASANILRADELMHGYELGGELVRFRPAEVAAMRDFGRNGLFLVGFKPLSSLKDAHNLRPPYFLQPDEERVRGSATAFAALLRRMAERRVFAVCRLVTMRTSAPRIVALLPQLEELEEDGVTQLRAPGMHLVPLPYADDLRRLEVAAAPAVTDEDVAAARRLVKAAQLESFDPDDFPNPVLQKHFLGLHRIALNQHVGEAEDVIVPPKELAELPEGKAFNERMYRAARPDAAAAAAAAADGDGAPAAAYDPDVGVVAAAPSRKRKAAEPPADDPSIDWDALDAAGVRRLTVPVLRTHLRANGQSAPAKKAELVEAVLAFHGKSA